MAGPNDGGSEFHSPDPLPQDVVEIAAKYATYGDSVKPNTAVADIRILLNYIYALEHRLYGLEKR